MKAESPFVVQVRDLPVRKVFDVPSVVVASAVAGLPMREALEGAPEDAGTGHMEADLYADGTHVFVTGQFSGHVMVACSRCVGPVKLPIDEALRVTFVPMAELPRDDVDAGAGVDDAPKRKGGASKAASDDADLGEELGEGDLDVFGFDGEKVDLEPLLREQFVLAVPYAPLCQDGCLGLCQQCGINKNTDTCSCEKVQDPRFAALASLKLPS